MNLNNMEIRKGNEIQEIVSMVLGDYEGEKRIDTICMVDRPKKEEIGQVLRGLYGVIFPGYVYSKLGVDKVLRELYWQMERLIDMGIRLGKGQSKPAHEINQLFFKTIPAIRRAVETDLLAMYEADPAAESYEEIILTYPGILAITTYRLAHVLYQLGVPVIPRLMTEYAHTETGIDIHPGATIGNYFAIDHGTGVVIGETAVLGEHVKIYQGVTIGALTTRQGQGLSGKKRHPTIGNHVTIYAGASILGGRTVIGDSTVIGGNAFVTESIPANSRVLNKNQIIVYQQDQM